MAQLLFTNNATTTIAGAISTGATSVTLATGTGAQFPNPGAGQYFVGTFNDAATGLLDEIVWVTARSGDVLTIVRAQEGTAAQAWNVNDLFSEFLTAGQLQLFIQSGAVPSASLVHYGIDTGAANGIIATVSPAIVSMDDGAFYEISVLNNNTGATTANFGFGNIPVVYNAGAGALVGGEVGTSVRALMVYDASISSLRLINPLNGGPSGSLILNTAGTTSFTVPPGVYKIRSRCWGAGGGSGGSTGSGSGPSGGAGGGYSEGIISVTPGQSITCIVGAGGTAGSTSGPTAGGTGGTSSVGSFITCLGGGGGQAATVGVVNNSFVSLGGTATGGSTMNLTGNSSDPSYVVSGTNFIVVGRGGGSWGGISAHGGLSTGATANGTVGSSPGGGSTAGANSSNGAVGAPGQIILEWGVNI